MSTLYRKYRPQTFREICGQVHIKITLENEIKTGHIAHAYLFCGPRAVGKTTIARLIAKSLNCENRVDGEAEPCNKCKSCLNITEGRNIDVIEIDAASHTGVDNVRENVIAAAKIASSGAKYKVFIIDEVHMLSISAFNALLKVLEEPPKNVIFVLCTTEIHKIPATIISRCERFDFKRISIKDVADKLTFIVKEENIVVDESVLRNVAKHSGGHMRDAESLLGQIMAIGGNHITEKEADIVIPRSDLSEVVSLLAFLTDKNAGGAIALINKILDEGIDLREFAGDLIETLRKMMLIKVNPTLSERVGLDFNEGLERELLEIGKKMDINRIVVFLEKFMSVRNKLRDSFIIQLPFEIAIAELCSEASPSPMPPVSYAAPRLDANVILSKDENIASTNNVNPVNISLEEVSRKWHEVIAIVKARNNSLVTILVSCRIKDVSDGAISLVFKYKFHKDRIDDLGVRAVLLDVLQEVFGGKVGIKTEIDENMEINTVSAQPISSSDDKNNKTNGDGNMMDNLLRTFGGKVVS